MEQSQESLIWKQILAGGEMAEIGWKKLKAIIFPDLLKLVEPDLHADSKAEEAHLLFSLAKKEIQKNLSNPVKNDGYSKKFNSLCQNIWFQKYLETGGEAVCSYLNGGQRKNNFAIKFLQKRNKLTVLKIVKGNEESYKDISQEGIIAVTQAVKNKTLKNPKTIHSYYINACKNQFYKKYTKTKKELLSELEEAKMQKAPDEIMDFLINEIEEQRNSILYQKLESAGKNCKEILLGKASGKKSAILAKELNTTEDAVNSRATQCRRTLGRLLLETLEGSCSEALTIYQMHRRYKRTAEEDQKLLEKIKTELGLRDLETAQQKVYSCMEKLYQFFFPNYS